MIQQKIEGILREEFASMDDQTTLAAIAEKITLTVMEEIARALNGILGGQEIPG